MERLLATLLLALLALPISPKPVTAVETSTVKFTSIGGRQVRAWLAKPDGLGPFPAVVLLHSCGGATSHVTDDWPDFLTDNGYVTMTPFTYRSRGFENCREDSRKGKRVDFFHNDAYGALDYLAAQPFVEADRVGVMGFSMGANAINNSIIGRHAVEKRTPNFAAAISLYGFCFAMPISLDGAVPLMMILGERDKKSVAQCGSKKIFAPAVEVEVLPGAYHAFDAPESAGKYDLRGNFMSYSSRATKQARALALKYLQKRMP